MYHDFNFNLHLRRLDDDVDRVTLHLSLGMSTLSSSLPNRVCCAGEINYEHNFLIFVTARGRIHTHTHSHTHAQ